MDVDSATFNNPHSTILTSRLVNIPYVFLSDTDECALGTEDCNVNAVCNNTMGFAYLHIMEMEEFAQVNYSWNISTTGHRH